MTKWICYEGDVITSEHAYADILSTAVMSFTDRVKPVSRKSLVLFRGNDQLFN